MQTRAMCALAFLGALATKQVAVWTGNLIARWTLLKEWAALAGPWPFEFILTFRKHVNSQPCSISATGCQTAANACPPSDLGAPVRRGGLTGGATGIQEQVLLVALLAPLKSHLLRMLRARSCSADLAAGTRQSLRSCGHEMINDFCC